MKDLRGLDKYRLKREELSFYGVSGDDGNGMFKVFVNNRSFHVVAANGGGWDHVSVSPCNQKRETCPTWEEMSAIKDMFFKPEERVVQFHPPKSEYINVHPYCLHLWKPNDGKEVPYPPVIFV